MRSIAESLAAVALATGPPTPRESSAAAPTAAEAHVPKARVGRSRSGAARSTMATRAAMAQEATEIPSVKQLTSVRLHAASAVNVTRRSTTRSQWLGAMPAVTVKEA